MQYLRNIIRYLIFGTAGMLVVFIPLGILVHFLTLNTVVTIIIAVTAILTLGWVIDLLGEVNE